MRNNVPWNWLENWNRGSPLKDWKFKQATQDGTELKISIVYRKKKTVKVFILSNFDDLEKENFNNPCSIAQMFYSVFCQLNKNIIIQL